MALGFAPLIRSQSMNNSSPNWSGIKHRNTAFTLRPQTAGQFITGELIPTRNNIDRISLIFIAYRTITEQRNH
jgi:hypothetical protein